MQWVRRRADLLVADARPTRGCVPADELEKAAQGVPACRDLLITGARPAQGCVSVSVGARGPTKGAAPVGSSPIRAYGGCRAAMSEHPIHVHVHARARPPSIRVRFRGRVSWGVIRGKYPRVLSPLIPALALVKGACVGWAMWVWMDSPPIMECSPSARVRMRARGATRVGTRAPYPLCALIESEGSLRGVARMQSSPCDLPAHKGGYTGWSLHA